MIMCSLNIRNIATVPIYLHAYTPSLLRSFVHTLPSYSTFSFKRRNNGQLPSAPFMSKLVASILPCCCATPQMRYKVKMEKLKATMNSVKKKKSSKKTATVDWKENTVEWS